MDSTEFKVFLMNVVSPEQAQTLLLKLIEVLPANAVQSAGENSYSIHDPHNGFIRMVIRENFLFGLLNGKSRQTCEMILSEMCSVLTP